MIKNSYHLENMQTASSESLQCIMQVIKRTSKKKKNAGVLNSYFFLQSLKFIQTRKKNL